MPSMRRIVGLLLLAAPSALGQAPSVVVDTGYRPALDGFATDNAAGSGAAALGACGGISALNASWYAATQPGGAERRTLAQVTRPILERKGAAYLNEIAAIAQAVEGRVNPLFDGDGRGTLDRVVHRMQREPSALVPIVLTGSSARAVPHRMDVYAVDRDASGRLSLRVSDPDFGSYVSGDPAHTKGPPPEVRLTWDPSAARWQRWVGGHLAETFVGSGVLPTPAATSGRLRALVDLAEQGVAPATIRERLGLPKVRSIDDLHVEAKKDPEVGGVFVHFDASALAALSESERQALDAQLTAFLAEPGAGALSLRVGSTVAHLHRVPLRSLLDPGMTTVGPLTRLRGYVRDPSGELSLLGEVEPGRPAIPLDVLTVALGAARRGRDPYVSLDMDPRDPSGPQRVRIGGLPDAHRRSAFVSTLLEADYEMKRMGLGRRATSVAEMRSYVDLVAERGAPQGELGSRFWMTLAPSTMGDLLETRTTAGDVLLVTAHVLVRTERMASAERGIAGAPPDPAAEEMAARMTAAYPSLALELEPLYRLQGLFEAAAVCGLLQLRGVRSDALDQLERRAVAVIEVPDSYPGIGPVPVGSGSLTVSGGVRVATRMSAASVASTDALASVAASGPGAVAVALPRELLVSGDAALGLDVEEALQAATSDVAAERFDEAAVRLGRVLQADPEHPEALANTAILHYLQGRHAEARAAIDRALPRAPWLRGLRGVLAAASGDQAAAQADADASGRDEPDDEAVAGWNALTRLALVDLPGAEGDLERLVRLAPRSPMVGPLRSTLRTLRRLGPEEAEKRMRTTLAMPPSIGLTLSRGTAAILTDPKAATALLERVLGDAEASPNPAVRDYDAASRARFGLVLAAFMASKQGPISVERARLHAEALAAKHPERAGGHLALAMASIAARAPGLEVASHVKAALGCRGDDPVLEDIGIALGARRVTASLGLFLWTEMSERGLDAAPLLAVLGGAFAGEPGGDVVGALAAIPELDVLDLRRKVLESGAHGVPRLDQWLPALRLVAHNVGAATVEDAVLASLVTETFGLYLEVEADLGTPEHVLSAARDLERALAGFEGPSGVEAQVARSRAGAWQRAAQALILRAGQGPSAEGRAADRKLRESRKSGDAAEQRQALGAVADALDRMRVQSRDAVAAGRKAFAGSLMGAGIDLVLAIGQQWATGELDQGLSLDGLTAEARASAEARRVHSAMDAMRTGMYVEASVSEAGARMAESLHSEVDRQAALALLEAAARMARDLTPPLDVGAVIQQVEAAPLRSTVPSAAESPSAPEEPLPMPARWPWLLGAAVALLAALAAALLARRRRVRVVALVALAGVLVGGGAAFLYSATPDAEPPPASPESPNAAAPAPRLPPAPPAPPPAAPPAPSLGEACAALEPSAEASPIGRLPMPFPELEAPDPMGITLRLSSLRGKVVLLNLWATWCAPCREEVPSLVALQRRLESAGLATVALASDKSTEDVAVLVGGRPTVTALLDTPSNDGDLGPRTLALGTRKLPETYVIDRSGRARYYVIGPRDWGRPEVEVCLRALLTEAAPASH